MKKNYLLAALAVILSLLVMSACSSTSSSPTPTPTPTEPVPTPAETASGATSSGSSASKSSAECSAEALTKAFATYSPTTNAAGENNNVGPEHLCEGDYAIGMVGTPGLDETVFLKASGSQWTLIKMDATSDMCAGRSDVIPNFPQELAQKYCDEWGPTACN